MTATRLAVALVAALLPGLFAWWEGRRLVPHLESPVFAELWLRARRRLRQVATVALAAVLVLGGWQSLWLVPLLVVALLAGSFPARRRVFGEGWSFAGYLGWIASLWAAVGLFWVLVIVTPLLVDAAGPQRVWVPAVLAVAMAAQLVRPRRDTLRLLRAGPLDLARVPGLREFLERLVGLSSAPAPRVFVIDLRGGRWANALALPHRREPAVLFTGPALELLQPREVLAILAHEVAHLEQRDSRFLRRAAVRAWLLLGGALAWAPLTWLVAPDLKLLLLVWPLAVVVAAHRALGRSRERETSADRRALELGADPEVLVSALVALHCAARLPRRLSAEAEARMTHPSLARRIQAIRAAAAAPAAEVGEPQVPLPLVVAGTFAGGWVVLDRERVTWLDGVPAGTPPERAALIAAATSARTLTYGRLAELRVEARSAGSHQLVAVDTAGQRTVWAVVEGSVAALQTMLDLVDARLTPAAKRPLSARLAAAGLTARLAAAVGLLSALLLPAGGSVALPALLVLVTPRVPSLLAGGVGALAGALLSWTRLETGGPLWSARLGAAAVAAAVGLVLLALGALRARRVPEERERGVWWPALALLACALLVWAGILVVGWLGGAGSLDAFLLYRGVRWAPSAGSLPLAAAAALFASRRRRQRVVAVACVLLAAPGVWVGSSAFRLAFVHDPLLGAGTAPREGVVQPALQWKRELEGRWSQLRVAPGGAAFAVSGFSRRVGGEPHASVLSWSIWRGGGQEQNPLAEVKAVDLAFSGASRALVATPAAPEHGASPGLELLLLELESGRSESVTTGLPDLFDPRLEVAADGCTWTWSGAHPDPSQSGAFTRVSGRLGEPAGQISRWDSGLGPGRTAQWLVGLGHGAALATALEQSQEELEPGFSAWTLFEQARMPLVVVDGQRTVTLCTTRLNPVCSEIPDQGGALCVAGDGEWSYLWRVTARAEGGGSLAALVALRRSFVTVVAVTSTRALLWSPGADPALLDLGTGTLTRVPLPASTQWSAFALAEPDLVGRVLPQGRGSEVALYRVAP